MAILLNHIIFQRLISLREELGYSQRQFVEKFNSFLEEKNYGISITENRYTNIEKRLSTTSEILIHFINYYQEQHDIDTTWLLTPNNFLCSKYVVYNDNETKELYKLRTSFREIEKIITEVRESESNV